MRQGSIENSKARHSSSKWAAMRAFGSTGFLLASLFAAPPASAEPTFPGTLADKAGGVCVVTCLTCHTDPAGGGDKLKVFGAAFGGAVKALEITGNTSSLDSFKDSDADGDGVKDLTEVLAGHDPTSPGATSICTPAYGCGARLSRLPPSGRGTVAPLLLAAAALAFATRRRAKSRSA